MGFEAYSFSTGCQHFLKKILGNFFESHPGENNKTLKLQVFALEFFILSPGWESNPRMSVLQTDALTTSPPGLLYATLYHFRLTKPSKYAMISATCRDDEIGRHAALKLL